MAKAVRALDHAETWRRRRKGFTQALRENARDWGFKRALHWVLMEFMARAFGLHLHYVRVGADRVDLLDPKPPFVPPGYAFRRVDATDLLPHVGEAPGLTPEFLENAFELGDEVAACFSDGQLVAFCFNKRHRAIVSDQLDLLVPNGFRYAYKSWTHPDHSLRNLNAMLRFIQRTHPNRAHEERSIWYVETHNYPSLLHGYRHPSARSLNMGFTGWIRVFGREIPFNSRQAKRIGFEFVRKSDAGHRQYVR